MSALISLEAARIDEIEYRNKQAVLLGETLNGRMRKAPGYTARIACNYEHTAFTSSFVVQCTARHIKAHPGGWTEGSGLWHNKVLEIPGELMTKMTETNQNYQLLLNTIQSKFHFALAKAMHLPEEDAVINVERLRGEMGDEMRRLSVWNYDKWLRQQETATDRAAEESALESIKRSFGASEEQ